MSEESIQKGMSEALVRCVRTASVAPHLQRTFSLLPQTVRIEAMVPPDPEALPVAARQLLKLGLLSGGRIQLGTVRVAESPADIKASPHFVFFEGEGRIELGRDDLKRDLRAVFTSLLGALFDASDTANVLESLAFQSQSLSTLRMLTGHMLAATD